MLDEHFIRVCTPAPFVITFPKACIEDDMSPVSADTGLI